MQLLYVPGLWIGVEFGKLVVDCDWFHPSPEDYDIAKVGPDKEGSRPDANDALRDPRPDD